jgi:hypothetical protein
MKDMKSDQNKQHFFDVEMRVCVWGMPESVPLIDYKAAQRLHKKKSKLACRRPLYENGGRVCVYGMPESVPGYGGRR